MKAKPLVIDGWTNCPEDFAIDIDGPYIKIIHAFQMLCPGCVHRGVPQTEMLYRKYNAPNKVQVVGLHSVFENHQAMLPYALGVFLSEWRISFPVAIDHRKEGEWMPETMRAYHLQGTPSLIVVDHKGDLKLCRFGHIDQDNIEALIDKLVLAMDEDKKQLAAR